jgi:hypothetical protein
LTISAMMAPVSESRKRTNVKPSVGGWIVATKAADTAACVASMCPLPRNSASAIASITTIASCAAPTPIASTSRSPTAMPTATPNATSSARRPRWETVRPSVMIAATGAKNGAWCPSTSVATSQAAPAATPTCSTDRHDIRSRSSRVRMDTRERSAASSISGAARSLSGRLSLSRSRGIGSSDPGRQRGAKAAAS